MLKFIFNILLTFNATSWLIVIYGIKEKWHCLFMPRWGIIIILLLIPIILTGVSIALIRWLGDDCMDECCECKLADNEFLPVYLGYFFVVLSIGDTTTLIVVYAIVFVFSYLTKAIYFNPLFLLFGYHFYHITTQYGTTVFVVFRGEIMRNPQHADLAKLKRVNDTTYISEFRKRGDRA